MAKNRPRFVPGASFAEECLEARTVLSAIGTAHVLGAAEVSTLGVRKSITATTLAAHAGTLGQPVSLTVTVRASVSAGSPTGTVRIVDQGNVIKTLTLSPGTTVGRFATSTATFTLTQAPGGPAYYFGRHKVSAVFVPSGSFAKSAAVSAFSVSPPAYSTLSGGVKIATTATGTGPQIKPGQTANVLYTGYLAKTGQMFDNSMSHGNVPLGFRVGAGQVIPGFDAGTASMRAGETRIIRIPPAQGYGSTANGSIPANSTLVFVVTLKSIS